MKHSETQMRSTRRRFSRVRAQRGFTLVEMLVVITIIGLIMSLVGPRVLNYLGESKVKAAKIQIQSFSSALSILRPPLPIGGICRFWLAGCARPTTPAIPIAVKTR